MQAISMQVDIKNRYSGAVIYSTQVSDLDQYPICSAVSRASAVGVTLSSADLAGADLRCANLGGASMRAAYLSGANLRESDLRGADLSCADLSNADMSGADLVGANLRLANMRGTNLYDADIYDADLREANLEGANLCDANLIGANLDGVSGLPSNFEHPASTPEEAAKRAAEYRELNPTVPVVEDLDARILEAVTGGGGALDMGLWHSCETTHCQSGWAIHLAGDAGYHLERLHGPKRAGAMIYMASTGRIPYFFSRAEDAMADIRAHSTVKK